MQQVAIIDYGMGNIWSVKSALEYIGASVKIFSSPDNLEELEYIILPGVGSFKNAMRNIKERGFDEIIAKAVNLNNAKLLGICLGMQLMGDYSEEDGVTKGLGLVPINVKRFKLQKEVKVPHIGFNTVEIKDPTGLFLDFKSKMDFYFVHSYKMNSIKSLDRIATCNYGGSKFLAAFEHGKLCGAQFHPEKSQTNGLVLLKNFFQ